MATIKPKKEYVINYENLSGGINIEKPSYQLFSNESPNIRNLRFLDGRLCSREGQTEVLQSESGAGHATYRYFWHEAIFAHIGESIVALRREAVGRSPETVEENEDEGGREMRNSQCAMRNEDEWTEEVLISGIPEIRGTFFAYDGALYYKTRSVFIRITATETTDYGLSTTAYGLSTTAYGLSTTAFTAAAVTPYIPVILMNASPTDASGDLYQPENRLSYEKTVWYNASVGVRNYKLPVIAHHVTKVIVDGQQMTTGWLYDPQTGIVHFSTAPPVTDPPTNNTVRITYYLENAPAKAAIEECRYAAVYGGTGALCVVLGGSTSQPNAYFWSGNSDIAMEPGYFPIEQYQLAGDADDAITGFGRQQSELVIFSSSSVGKTSVGTAELNGRLSIDMPYQQINSKIGCTYPWSIELIENNLVWADRSGIWTLLDTSAANENCITSISQKVNGSPMKRGLCYDLMQCEADEVCSLDDGGRYWISAGGNTWVWQYDISSFSNPSWFLYTDICAISFVLGEAVARSPQTVEGGSDTASTAYGLRTTAYELSAEGRLSSFDESLNDYGEAIEKRYEFAQTMFGSYDCSKNVNSVIFCLGSDAPTDTEINYMTDYDQWQDMTDLIIPSSVTADAVPPLAEAQSPRGSEMPPAFHSTPLGRSATPSGEGLVPKVFRRRPMARRILHFSMKLTNANVDEDMQIINAQVFYNIQGRLR